MSVITKNNSFETGAAAGTALTSGSGGNTAGAGSAFLSAVFASTNNTITYFTPSIRGGLGARVLAAGGASASFGWDESPGQAAVYMRAYVQIRKFHTANTTLLVARGTETGAGFYVRMTAAGVLQVVQASGAVVLATAPAALALNTWYRIEVYADRSGAWALRCYLGDTYTTRFAEMSGTAATPGMAANFTFLRYGMDGTAVQGEMYYDDVAFGTSWLGPVSTGTVSAVAIESADPGWTAVGTGSLIDAVSDEDTATYAQSPGLTAVYQPIKLRLGELAAGDVTVRVRLGGDSLPDARVRLMQGTTVIATWTSLNLPASGADYEYSLTAAQASAITDRTNLYLEIAGIL